MINKLNRTNTLPQGYGISKVKAVYKVPKDISKKQEKTNKEMKDELFEQRSFLTLLQEQMMKAEEEKNPQIIKRIN